jgi:peptidyl-prolyl cis-trans isomerase D
MLKVLRDNLKYLSWVLWVVIAVFILFVFVDFGTLMPGGGAPTEVAAKVGDEEVTFGELQRTYRNMESFYRQTYGDRFTPELAEQLQLPRQALESLVNRKIQLAEAKRVGLEVSDAELSREILAMPAFTKPEGGFVGDELYRRTLQSNGITVPEFEESLRQDLMIQKLQNILEQNLYVTDEEVEEAYREQVERAKIRYFQVAESEFADQVEISDEEVANAYAEHKAEYRLPERRKVAYLLVDQNRLRSQINVDESELFTYYQDHQEDFNRDEQVRARHILLSTSQRTREEAQREMAAIRRRIEGGEDFAAVAREVSEDPGSKDRGGELGFFGRGQMTPEFEEAAFNAQVGDLVGPIDTPFGVHLIEVEGHREGGVRPFAEVRSQIQLRLATERMPAEAKRRIDAAVAQLHGEAPEAVPAAAEEGSEGETTVSADPEVRQMEALAPPGDPLVFAEPEPFARDAVVPGLGRDQAFLDTVFSLEPGQLSDPVETQRGWAVVYLEQVLEPRDQELAEVEATVRQQLTQRKQKQLAVDRLAEAKEEIEGGKSLDQVAEELGQTVEETTEFGPKNVVPGLGYNPRIAQAAFTLDVGEVGGPFESRQGAVLIEVADRTSWDPQAFENAKEETRSRLEGDKLNRLLSSLVRERRRVMDIRYAPQLETELGSSEGLQGS